MERPGIDVIENVSIALVAEKGQRMKRRLAEDICRLPVVVQVTLSAMAFCLQVSCVDRESAMVFEGLGPVASILQTGDRIEVIGAEGTALHDLVSLESFGEVRPDLLNSRDWGSLGELPDPVDYYDGFLWDLGGRPAAVQIIRRVNQENSKPYYLLRLKLYTLTPLDYVQPDVRAQLPNIRFSVIGFAGADGGDASIKRSSDGIYLYWFE